MSAQDDLEVDGAPIVLRDGSRVRIREGRRSDGNCWWRDLRT